MNLQAEHALAQFAWEKVRFTKRVLAKDGLRAGLPVAWYYGLTHLNPTEHVPESVRDDFKAFSQFMRSELAGGQNFPEVTSEAEIEEATSAFWKLYDAVTLWYLRLNERLNDEESRTQ